MAMAELIRVSVFNNNTIGNDGFSSAVGSGVGGLPVTKPCVVVAAASLVFSFITCGGVKLNLLHALHQ